MPTEATIQSAIIRLAHRAGWLVLRLNSGVAWSRDGQRAIRLAPPGTPDLLLLGPDGQAVFVEVKTAHGQLTPAQVTMIARLQALGHQVVVAQSVDDVAPFLTLLV